MGVNKVISWEIDCDGECPSQFACGYQNRKHVIEDAIEDGWVYAAIPGQKRKRWLCPTCVELYGIETQGGRDGKKENAKT